MKYCFFRLVRYLSCAFDDERILRQNVRSINLSRLLIGSISSQEVDKAFVLTDFEH